jgi:plastocyanin
VRGFSYSVGRVPLTSATHQMSFTPSPAESLVPAESAAPAAVSIIDLAFEPAALEVGAGATVTWTNDDSIPHTVTAREGDFNSGVLQSGGSFSQTFSEPGTFEYFCAIHPSMTGTVTVTP